MSKTNSLKPPAGADLKRVASYTWPAGHVGHLSEAQSSALEQFKSLCQQKGYYEPPQPDSHTAASHDDETLLRYLRARKFIPKDAWTQFQTTEDWRKENQLDSLYEGIDIHEYEQTRRLYPQWTGRRDHRGIPVYVFEVANVKYKDLTAYEQDADRDKKTKGKDIGGSKVPRKMLRLFALYENMCRFVLPLCSAVPDRPNAATPVSQSSNIVDISKVGLKQFWNLRSHLQDSSALATAHYPETLDRIFVIGAPSFFPTVWDWVKNWFDPITVAKIQIVPDAKKLEVLSKFIAVENIPKKYGGQLDWNFGDMPFLEDKIVANLRWKEDVKEKGHRTFPIGPIKWQYDEDGDLVALGVGSENGAPRKTVLAGLHPGDGVARLALSPGRQSQSPLFASVSGQGATPAVKREATPEVKSDATPEVTTKSEKHADNTAASTSAVSSVDQQPAVATPQATTTGEGKQFNTLAAARLINSDATATTAATTTTTTTSHTEPYTVPYTSSHSSFPPPDSRTGTSTTRFTQQGNTHAEGQLQHGTPNTTIDGQGTSHTIIEPRTVGQAPKETPLYDEEEVDGEESKPGYLEQAQNLVGGAVESVQTLPGVVLGAVGLGEKKAEVVEEEEEKKEKKEDSRVDGLSDGVLEEFVRERSMTKEQGKK